MRATARAERDAQIGDARRHGLSMLEIAEQFEITKQAVHWILRRDGVSMPSALRPAGMVEARCAGCGKVYRMPARILRARRKKSRSGNTYCSPQCWGAAVPRKLDDAAILRAIELRTTTTLSWVAIGATLGVSGKATKKRAWKHLSATGQLTAAPVRTLWRPRPGGRWREKKTGHSLSTETLGENLKQSCSKRWFSVVCPSVLSRK
jgi:hypothetical protein